MELSWFAALGLARVLEYFPPTVHAGAQACFKGRDKYKNSPSNIHYYHRQIRYNVIDKSARIKAKHLKKEIALVYFAHFAFNRFCCLYYV